MNDDKQLKASNNARRRQKGVIAGLSVALALVSAAAVVAPIVILTKKPGPGEVTTFQVTFVTNAAGVELDPQTIVKGNHATDPAILFDGHTLIGWFENPEFSGDKFDFKNTPINNDITLYAKWQEDAPITQYKVITYKAGDYGSFDETSAVSQTQTIVEAGTEFKYAVRPTWYSKNEEYGFKEWQVDGQKINDDDLINSNITITAAHKQNILKQTVTFAINETGIKLNGKTSLTVNKHTKFKQLQKSLPVATYPDKSKVFAYWTLDGSKVEPEHEINANEVYYPYFAEVEQSRIIFEVQLSEGQTIKSGSKTFDFTYDAETTMPTFGSFNKPEVVMDGKLFAGWYKDDKFNKEWSNDEQITRQSETPYTYKLYPKFESPITNPIISFQADPAETEQLTWVGNQIIKCEVPVNVKFDDLIKPAVYKKAVGDPSTGYTSPYYFKKWYTYDTDGNKIDVPATITNSLTIYPEFETKPVLKFKYNNGEKEVTKEVSVNPGSKWEEVKTPSDVVIYKTAKQEYFGYWVGKDTDGEDIVLEPGVTVDDIDASKEITPYYLTTYNIINFSTSTVLEDEITSVTVKYEGTSQIGISQDDNYISSINKPIPTSNDEEHPNLEFVKWQFLTNQTSWSDVTPETKAPATTSTTNYYIRPVMKEVVNYTITYDANGGEIEKIKGKTYDTTKVTPTDTFAEIFKPSVKKEGYKFSYWAIKTGESKYEKVSANKVFEEDTTLYAIYDVDEVARKVEFKLTTADASDTSFKATITGTSYLKNASSSTNITFGSIPKATATKYLHNFEGWYFDEACTKKIPDTYILPSGETPTTAYAKFTPAGQYYQLKIKHDDSNYKIIGDDIVYVKIGDKIDLQYGSHDINGITIKKVGYEVDGWTDSEGKIDLESTAILHNYDNIVPKFKAAKRQVKLSKNGDNTILGYTDGDTIEVDLYGSLYDAIKDIVPTKTTYETFDGWYYDTYNVSGEKVKNKITATSGEEVSSNITVYPQFLPTADFLHSNLPYYWDAQKEEYAAILSFDDAENLTVRYASSPEEVKVSKSNFDKEIKFGDMMTSIPAHFMQGCTEYNNAGVELKINERITYIGDDFLFGCSSFNQNVNIKKERAGEIIIGENFMRECINFNKNIDLSTSKGWDGGLHVFKPGFMYDCYNAKDTIIDLRGRIKIEEAAAKDLYTIMSTSSSIAPMNIKLWVLNEDNKTTLETMYPNLDGSGIQPYRKISITVKNWE